MDPSDIATKALRDIADAKKKSADQLIEIAEKARTEISKIYSMLAATDPKAIDMRKNANSKNLERIQSVQLEIIEMKTITNNPASSTAVKAEGRRQRDRLQKLLAVLNSQDI